MFLKLIVFLLRGGNRLVITWACIVEVRGGLARVISSPFIGGGGNYVVLGLALGGVTYDIPES